LRYATCGALAAAIFAFVVACAEREEAPAAAPAAQVAPAAAELGVADDEEEPVELDEAEEPSEPVPVDEMDQPALEAACFEGRQEACDRLGH
jgi:hypothetical protein